MRLILAVLLCVLLLGSPNTTAWADPGAAPAGTAIAEYHVSTGEIIVSVNDIVNWVINSASSGLTGPDSGIPPLPADGGFEFSDDASIGETSLTSMTYQDVDLGQVAALNLPANDLTISWNPALSTPLETQPVVYIFSVPEPTSLALAAVGLLGIGCCRRRR